MKTLPEFQLSPRTIIRPGDRIRVSGGPVHVRANGDKIRVGERGQFIIRDLFKRRGRIYATASKIDNDGMYAGVFTLFISGRAVRSALTETILNKPYRVRKARS
jgi:hypothetical protein